MSRPELRRLMAPVEGALHFYGLRPEVLRRPPAQCSRSVKEARRIMAYLLITDAAAHPSTVAAMLNFSEYRTALKFRRVIAEQWYNPSVLCLYEELALSLSVGAVVGAIRTGAEIWLGDYPHIWPTEREWA